MALRHAAETDLSAIARSVAASPKVVSGSYAVSAFQQPPDAGRRSCRRCKYPKGEAHLRCGDMVTRRPFLEYVRRHGSRSEGSYPRSRRQRGEVADDNAENRAVAKATLEDEGYDVLLAADGEQAVVAFSERSPDCVLLDIKMPKMDGVAACREIRTLPGGQDVPVVFLTALRDVETFDRAQLAGGDDFMTKPYRPTELVVRVEAALRLRRVASERNDLYAQVKQQRDDLQRLQLQKEQLAAFLVHDLKIVVYSQAS